MYKLTFFIKQTLSITQERRASALWYLLLAVVIGLTGCRQGMVSSNASARGERLEVKLGEIKEVTVSGLITNPVELVGTSENKEVVEVSRRRLTAAKDTVTPSDSGPAVFEIKGVTPGTARVTFSEKRMDGKGKEKIRKAYVVKVVPGNQTQKP